MIQPETGYLDILEITGWELSSLVLAPAHQPARVPAPAHQLRAPAPVQQRVRVRQPVRQLLAKLCQTHIFRH